MAPMSVEFGKQFAEARQKQGLSIEQAAEATKIKLDYLSSIESGDLAFGLPDIYVHGFIKIYAKYLQMDVNATLADCPIRQFEVLGSKKEKKISYTTIIANEKEQEESSEVNSDDGVRFLKKVSRGCALIWKFFSQKKVIITLLSLISIGIVAALAYYFYFTNKGKYEKISQAHVDSVLAASEQSTLSLISTGNVKVVVRNKGSGEKIFSGNLESGNVKKVQYSAPVQVFFDHGEFLLIKQANGEQLYPSPGRGGMEIK
jgi:cytoskeletal protein RodZ